MSAGDVQRQAVGIDGRVLRPHDAVAGQRVHGRTQRLQLLLVRQFRQVRLDQPDGTPLVQRADGTAIGIANDCAQLGIGRIGCDAGDTHGCRVHPHHVVIGAVQRDGPIWQHGVQPFGTTHSIGQRVRRISVALDPTVTGVCCRPLADCLLDLRNRIQAEQVQHDRLRPTAVRMRMPIAEPRYRSATLEVDRLIPRCRPLHGVVAQRDHGAVVDGHCARAPGARDDRAVADELLHVTPSVSRRVTLVQGTHP